MPPRAELSSGFTPGFGLPGLATAYGLDDLTWTLLIGAAVLLLALVAVRVSARSGLPTMLLYVGGAERERMVGLRSYDDIEKKLNKYLSPTSTAKEGSAR